MVKQLKLQILNVTLFLLLVLQVIVGVRLWFVELLGWEDSNTFMNLHLVTGFGLAVLILVHIYTNWWWVKSQFGFSK